MSWSKEKEINVWDDDCGQRITVRPDRDGLGLVEVVLFSEDGKEEVRLSFPPEAAGLLANAIAEMAQMLKEPKA